MREPKLAHDGWHLCDGCREIWNGRDLADIEKYSLRVGAGSKVPSGECPAPDCGALCFPHRPSSGTTAQRHGLGMGYCQKDTGEGVHGRFKMDSEQTECPTCEDTE